MSVSGAVGSLTHSLTEHQISHVVITALRSLKIYQPIRSLSLSTFPSCMANMWAHDDGTGTQINESGEPAHIFCNELRLLPRNEIRVG